MEPQNQKNERIDLRITPEEKELFLKAYKISGDRSFSGFITKIIKAKSTEIIAEKEKILASERDRKIFFEALLSDQEPTQTLKNAAKKFKTSQA